MATRNRRSRSPRRRRVIEPLDPVRRGSSAKVRRAGLASLGVGVLILVNLYVFVWGRRSVRSVYRIAQVQAARAEAKAAPRRKGGGASGSRGRRADRSLDTLRLPRSITQEALAQQEDEALLEVEAFTISGRIHRGDNLYSALKRVGVNRLIGDVIVRTLSGLVDFRRARPGQRFSVRISQDRRRLLGFEFRAGPGESYRIVRAGRKLLGKRIHRPVVTRVFEMVAPVRQTLWQAFHDLGEDGRLLAAFSAIFSWDLNLYTDVRPGDAIRLIVEKQFQGEQFLRYGRLLAAEFLGRRKRRRAYWYRMPRVGGGYFDDQGRSLHRVLLRAPLKYKRISSPFDAHRMHPILHRVRPHLGVDYAAPAGTPVWAVADGEVLYVGRNRAAGKMVVIDHGNDMRTVYMHLQRFRRGIAKGVRVRQREVIAYVGATGLATGPHLHFGLKLRGAYVDPDLVERSRRPPVPARYRGDFRRSVQALRSALSALRAAARPYKRVAAAKVVRVAEQYRRR